MDHRREDDGNVDRRAGSYRPVLPVCSSPHRCMASESNGLMEPALPKCATSLAVCLIFPYDRSSSFAYIECWRGRSQSSQPVYLVRRCRLSKNDAYVHPLRNVPKPLKNGVERSWIAKFNKRFKSIRPTFRQFEHLDQSATNARVTEPTPSPTNMSSGCVGQTREPVSAARRPFRRQ